MIESGLTGAELAMPLNWSVKLGMVPCKLIYGLNTAMFESMKESPALTTGDDAHGAHMGQLAIGFPVTSHPTRGAFGPC